MHTADDGTDGCWVSKSAAVIRGMVLMQAVIAFHFHNPQPTVADAAGVALVRCTQYRNTKIGAY